MGDGPPLFTGRFRVTMADTDAAQLIYFGAPLRWAESLLTGYLAGIGVPLSGLLANGLGLPAVRLTVSYRSPLRLDDHVRGELRAHSHSRRAITWRCEMFREGEQPAAVEVLITQVAVQLSDGNPAAVALPGVLAQKLNQSPTAEEKR